MTYREMGVYSIGEQPLDRIRHRFQQLKEQYDCLCDVEFDERGIPGTPRFCGLMRQVYHHHVNTAHARKSVALDTYSLWKHTHDPKMLKFNEHEFVLSSGFFEDEKDCRKSKRTTSS